MLSSWAVGVFFLRFWKLSKDRFFLFLFLAFWVMALNWIGLLATQEPTETRHYVNALRLLAFVLIFVGIIDKNRRGSKRRAPG